MRVLVTGGRGFIGSYVCQALERRGIEVLILDRRSDPSNVRPSMFGDVRNATDVSEAVAFSDGVIHLAGVLGTAETINNPWPAVEVNIQGSLNIFQACRQHGKRCAYITVGNHWMNNSYSITKTTAERLAWMFNREHGTEIAVVRALNAYGPRQKDRPVRKIMPNFILPALRGDPIRIYGDGSQVMDMIHVRDVADVLVRALLEPHGNYRWDPVEDSHGPAFQAGTGRRTTVAQIAEAVLEATGSTAGLHFVPMRAGEPEGSVVLGDPATLAPLYEGRIPNLIRLEDGIEETVSWYRDQIRAALPV